MGGFLYNSFFAESKAALCGIGTYIVDHTTPSREGFHFWGNLACMVWIHCIVGFTGIYYEARASACAWCWTLSLRHTHTIKWFPFCKKKCFRALSWKNPLVVIHWGLNLVSNANNQQPRRPNIIIQIQSKYHQVQRLLAHLNEIAQKSLQHRQRLLLKQGSF